MFPYIFMRRGQVRLCQTCQRFIYPLRLLSVNFLSCLCILVVLFKCRTHQPCAETVGFMVSLFIKAQARSSSLSRPSALLHVNEFINLSELPLSAAPYSIASLALANGLWSTICNFFTIIIFCLFRKKERGIYG